MGYNSSDSGSCRCRRSSGSSSGGSVVRSVGMWFGHRGVLLVLLSSSLQKCWKRGAGFGVGYQRICLDGLKI